jgi:fucose 4-O-acetylase-like acetyltransferase
MKNNNRAVHYRLDSIDILKGITILLVVAGHFCPNGSPRFWHLLRDIIYSFHMPLFMIISGYLYAFSSRIQSINDYLKLRFFRIFCG